MSTLRSINAPTDFAVPGAPDLAGDLSEAWEDGSGRPEWSFVLNDGETPIGRVAFVVDPTCPPEYLGDLPPDELHVFDLWLPDDTGLATGLVVEALTRIVDSVPDRLQVRTNRDLHAQVDQRLELAESLELDLFQEKEGFLWSDDGSDLKVPGRLVFRSIDDVGSRHYRDVFAGVPRETLDRNDRWYRRRMSESDWASVMMTYSNDDDAPMWLEGRLPDGRPIGIVAVSDFNRPHTATITYVGVLPPHRGNGYIDDLIAAGTASAGQLGFTSILSDVDVENHPMMAAMERSGHHAASTNWHGWHHVGSVSDLVTKKSTTR